MMTISKTLKTCVLVGGSLCWPLVAQDDKGAGAPEKIVEKKEHSWGGIKLVTIGATAGDLSLEEFVRGPLGNVLKAPPNILIDPDVADLPMPSLQVKQASLLGLMESLGEIMGFSVTLNGSDHRAAPIMVLKAKSIEIRSTGLFVPNRNVKKGDSSWRVTVPGVTGAGTLAIKPMSDTLSPLDPSRTLRYVALDEELVMRVYSLADLQENQDRHEQQILDLLKGSLGNSEKLKKEGFPKGAVNFSWDSRLLVVRLPRTQADEVGMIVKGYVESFRQAKERVALKTRFLEEKVMMLKAEIAMHKAQGLGPVDPEMAGLYAKIAVMLTMISDIEEREGMR